MTLLFLHIPKAGGTTFRKILHRQYNENDIYTIPFENWPIKAKQELKSMGESIADIKLIKGHMPFGWHNQYPFNNSSYFTMMREPVKRFISHFNYEKIEGRPYHRIIKNITLEKYILHPTIRELDNCMTRYYANCLDIEVGQLNHGHLEMAKNNLEKHFSQILLVEEFDKGLILCKKFFNWKKSIIYSESNVNYRYTPPKLSDATLKSLNDQLKYDIELYNFGKEIFYRNWSRIKHNMVRYNLFKIKNLIFKKIHPLYATCKVFILKTILGKDLSSYV